MSKLHELGVAEAARQIREGRITSVELAQALLERIETFDPAHCRRGLRWTARMC